MYCTLNKIKRKCSLELSFQSHLWYVSKFTSNVVLSFWQNNVEIKQHKSLKERCEAADILKSSRCPAPIMVDTMEDEATKAYGAFPERLFIIQQGQIVYEGGMGPYNYDLNEVTRWLEKWRSENQ